MAVSFKVPSSPAKSIFTIDEFLGVDLTNSPANIQDNRSPNAPNMTRLVPGKVRKRMGYEKYITIGTRTNLNYVMGTSYDEGAFIITEDNVNEWVRIYGMYATMKTLDGNPFTLYCECDYKAEEDFVLNGDSWTPLSEGSTPIEGEEGWYHYSGTNVFAADETKTEVSIKSAVPQTIYIRRLSVMYAKDYSYKWSPCPTFWMCYENADNEVFGFHKYVSPSVANAMTDVNRALGTGTAKTLTFSSTEYQNADIYFLAEKMLDGRKFRIKFDYSYTITEQGLYSPTIFIANNGLTNLQELDGVEIGSHSGSFLSDVIEFRHQQGYDTLEQKVTMVSHYVMTMTFSNFSVLYDMTDDYIWSAAPEDSLNFYYPEDLYNYGSRNYSVNTSAGDNVSMPQAGTYSLNTNIQTTGSLKGYSKLSFDIRVSYNNSDVTKTDIYVQYYDAYSSALKNLKIGTLPGVVSSETSYSFLLSPTNTWQTPKGTNWSDNNYITKIIVSGVATGVNNMYVYLSNIKLQAATQKPNLNESGYAKLYHVGDRVWAYKQATNDMARIATNMNPHRSMSWQFGNRLFLIDGKNNYLYNYTNNTLDRIGQTNAYIPLVTISKAPNGGGTSYEPLNLLQPGFKEQFICTDSTTRAFSLSFNKLDNTTVKAEVLDSNGVWQEKTQGTDFNVNRTTGVITFVTAPGPTPIAGEDNVRITAYKTVEGYADRIRRCTFGTLFGVNGASDRLFLSGNPDMPNYDWYSEKDDPTYFPDTGYATLGLEVSAIVGYSLVNNYLATHKDENEPSQSVFIREGDLITKPVTTSVGTTVNISEPAFKLINTLQGAPALSPYTFGYVETEPLFFTKSGIFALTTQDITGDKYGQNRSFYLNGALTEERYLQNAYACIHDNMYYLAVNNKMYLIDGLQATRTDRSDPYSTRQYVGFMWNNIPATIVFSDEGNLYFGTADGKICRFYNDVDSLDSYNDDGYPIDAWWETPDLDGKLFYKNKTFRYFASRLMAALATSVKMWAMKTGSWTLIKEDDATGRYFDFGNVNFEKFSFSTDQTEKVVHAKIKVKKVDKARFKLENDALNEPFGIFNIALEYVESGNYKG